MPSKPRIVVMAALLAASKLLILTTQRAQADGSSAKATPADLTLSHVGRIWHGRVPESKAAEYYDYLNREGIRGSKRFPATSAPTS